MEEDKKDKFLAPENEIRQVEAPDGCMIEIDPLKDYFTQDRPKPYKVRKGPVENFMNWLELKVYGYLDLEQVVEVLKYHHW